jgi:LacI family transcriptional regulator
MPATNPRARRPTLADVAATAGVSRATASRALAASPNVSEPTRERVWAAARRLAFEPNHLARSLRRGSTMAVGIVLPQLTTAFHASALHSAQQVLEDAGYQVLVIATERSTRRERDGLRSLRAHGVDGVLVASYGGFEDVGVPTVFFDDAPGNAGAGAVAYENAAGTRLLVEHLVQVHGHRRIAYFGIPDAVEGEQTPRVFAGRERLEGFRAAMGDAGLPVPAAAVRLTILLDDEARARMARAILAADPPPTAVVTGSDAHAVSLLHAARELGVRVPGDVALACFDEPSYADLLDPPMTSLERRDREIGRRAAEMLLAALADPEAGDPGALVRIPLALRVRASCGCAGRGLESIA